jgi:hypothetical protein
LLQQIISKLQHEFAMTDLGLLHHFLGISVRHTKTGLLLSQEQYATGLLEHLNMTNCNSCHTPADSKSKSSLSDGTLLETPMEYQSLTGALQYLTLT